ncbi:MAG: hypothetical protein LBL06_05910, partial [Treponema sp.]|nr:hypothetical protein [Treponema sp.]
MLYNRYAFLKIGICLFLTACVTEEVKIPILPWTPPPDQQITVHNDLLIDVLDYKDSSLKD